MDQYKKLNPSPNYDDSEIRQNSKNSLLFKILFLIFVIITLVLLIVVVVLATKGSGNEEKDDNTNPSGDNGQNGGSEQKENEEQIQKAKAGYSESWNELFGEVLENISYVDGDTLNNSFKNGSKNYDAEIGMINGGKDYTKNDNNKYTLYISQGALNKNSKHNGIFLFIHGANEKKENMEHHCRRYAKMGYITATMDYTELFKGNPSSNVFRVMDEITYCLSDIKQRLVKNYNFNGDKLELAIGGFSIGSNFAMLYGYSMKHYSPIPIRFIIDISGYLDLDPNYWFKLTENNSTLENLEPETINQAMSDGNLTRFHYNESTFLFQMNGFLGNRYNINQLGQILKEDKLFINDTNELYQELFNSSRHFFVTYHINKTKDNELIPILCEYGGNDQNIGVANFKHLRQIQRLRKNLKIDLVYMRYGDHFLMSYDTKNGKKAMKDMNTMILNYAKTYFRNENYEAEQMEKYFESQGKTESWHILYGIKLENIPYAENNKIINTFKYGSDNYNEEIGIINNGTDYDANELNNYNLYIPSSALNKTNEHNGIILFIHGHLQKKENMDYLGARYAKLGYITAIIEFNEIDKNNPHTNQFRQRDEISACIKNIKKKLKDEYNFNETKLELALGGHSLGGVLTLLYGYSMKNKSLIPIKFLINLAGVLDINRNYYYKVAKDNETLESIEPDSINLGIENGNLTNIFPNDRVGLEQLNSYFAYRYNDSDISQMVDANNNINYTSEKYQDFYKSYKYCLGSFYINKTTEKESYSLPTLCEYGGNDPSVGVAQFKLLRELSDKYHFPLDLVYPRYADHSLVDCSTENGIKAMREIHSKILEYAKKYFTSAEY